MNNSVFLIIAGLLIVILMNDWLNLPPIWSWVVLAIFFNQAFITIGGFILVLFRYGFKRPNEKSYTLKGEYILPFKGAWTVTGGGIGKEIAHHSWAIIPSQRYAYDFSVLEDDEDIAGDDEYILPTRVEEYPAYGKDIIAIADGEVVRVSNKHVDSRTNGMKTFCDTTDQNGNFVVIKHYTGEYSWTCHLMPESICVKKGDKVKQGQVIAKCGNSGNSTAPHIHFQLQSSRYFHLSVGLPIAFTNIEAKQSTLYEELYRETGRDIPSRAGNLIIVGNKTYIGRGLDVENKDEFR